MDATETRTTAPARRRDWVGLGLLAIPCVLISVNSNLLNLALPALAADLRPCSAQLLWIYDIDVFLVAGLLLPSGLLADRFGRRRIAPDRRRAVFGLASIGAALAAVHRDRPDRLPWSDRGRCGDVAPSTVADRSMFQVPRSGRSRWESGRPASRSAASSARDRRRADRSVSWRAVFAVIRQACSSWWCSDGSCCRSTAARTSGGLTGWGWHGHRRSAGHGRTRSSSSAPGSRP